MQKPGGVLRVKRSNKHQASLLQGFVLLCFFAKVIKSLKSFFALYLFSNQKSREAIYYLLAFLEYNNFKNDQKDLYGKKLSKRGYSSF